jgi:hypothetical protein
VAVFIAGSVTSRIVVGVLLIAAAIGSGMVSARAQTPNWASDREELEDEAFGAQIDSFIDSPTVDDAVRRPERDSPHDFPPEGGLAVPGGQDKKYSKSFYTGDLALFGWVNIRAMESYGLVKFSMATEDPELNERTLDFWRSPGIMIEYNPAFPTSAQTQTCVDTGACGHDVEVTPVSYSGNGTEFVYDVTTSHATTLAANEAYYSGWSGRLCPAQQGDEECVSVVPYSSPQAVLLLDVPPGEWTIHLQYTLPGLKASWLIAVMTFLALWGHAGWRYYATRRKAQNMDLTAEATDE